MQHKQANPFLWQVSLTGEAFQPPLITPKSTDKEIRYCMGQQWAIDVFDEWLKAGRRELLTIEHLTNWNELFNVPVFDLSTPMDVIMFWAGVQSVMTWMGLNVVD